MKIEMVREICMKIAADHGFKLDVPISENGRLTTTLGRVMYTRIDDDSIEILAIEFSKQFLLYGEEDSIMDVILHELAHAFVFIETGMQHGHDGTFRAMCRRIGCRRPSAEDGVEYKVPESALNKYTIRCSCCGKVIGYRQRACSVTKEPHKYHSSCCKADLIVTQNF